MKSERIAYDSILNELNILNLFKQFNVHIVGTLPLDIATEESDIDIICHYKQSQMKALYQTLTSFQHFKNWEFHSWQQQGYDVQICRFDTTDWVIEFFCSRQPLIEQFAYRHFYVEQRLLNFANSQFREDILYLKNKGIKTEPAFSQVLNLQGDPYLILSDLFEAQDMELLNVLFKNGYLK